ncbi:MAG: hypothetical protein KIT32_03710 [Rhodocyclaceae bacterium]|nr:hypothetical protein [Rhodocyclaceae bacterium]
MTMRRLHDREHAQYLEGGHSYLDGQPVRLWFGLLIRAEVSVTGEGPRPAGSVFDASGQVRCGLDGGVLQRRIELQVSE